jgi:hypothetical protein
VRFGDHLGTTRPARGQTTCTSATRALGVCTRSDQQRCLLIRPGGQGVAGSNPVVPTAVGSPLVLVISPGQRAFFIPCGGYDVDLDCEGMGTICGPSVDTARSSRGYDHKSRWDCSSWQTPAGGPDLPVYIEVQIRGDNSGIPVG